MTKPRKLTDNFIATLVDDEVVLIDMEGGELFSLKGSARTIWELIDGKNSRTEMAQALTEAYEVDRETAAADLEALLGDLSEAGLVEG